MHTKDKSQEIRLTTIFLLIAFIGILVYFNSVDCQFAYDDMPNIVHNEIIKNIHGVKYIWNLCRSRFLVMMSIALNYHIGKLNPSGYHLFSMFFHIICSFLVYLAVLTFLKTPQILNEKITRPPPQLFALFTSLIFLVHPLQTQSVTYIIQRAEIVAMIFYLLAVIFYINARNAVINKERQKTINYFVAAGLSAFLGALSKQTIFTLPLMIMAVEFYFYSPDFKNLKKNLTYFSPFFLLLLIPTILYKGPRDGGDPISMLLPAWQYLFTEFSVLITYLRLFFAPYNQNLDYDYPITQTFFEPGTMASFAGLLVILWIAVKLFKKERIMSFSIIWFFITLSITSSIFPILDVIYEHRLYPALFGLSMFLVLLFWYMFRFLEYKKLLSSKYWVVPMIMVVIGFSFLAYERNKVWRTPFTLWSDISKKSPLKARPRNNVGMAYSEIGFMGLAIENYRKAIELAPTDYQSHNNLGVAYQQMGESDYAIGELKAAIKFYPDFYEAQQNIGAVYISKNDLKSARKHLNLALKINPYDPKTYFLLGETYRVEGRADKAIYNYKKAIEINPTDALYFNALGTIYLNQKLYKQARYNFDMALRENPDLPDVLNNIGICLFEEGNQDLALDFFRNALILNPDLYIAYNNIGNIYRRTDRLDAAEFNYKKALSIKSDYLQAYYNLGLVYEKTGELEKAEAAYKTIVDSYPNYKDASKKLKAIQKKTFNPKKEL